MTADLWLIDGEGIASQLTADSQRDSFVAAVLDGERVAFQRTHFTGGNIRTLENRILVAGLENGNRGRVERDGQRNLPHPIGH